MALREEAWRQAVAGADGRSEPHPRSSIGRRESSWGWCLSPTTLPSSTASQCCGPVCTPQVRASFFLPLWPCPLCSRVQLLSVVLGLDDLPYFPSLKVVTEFTVCVHRCLLRGCLIHHVPASCQYRGQKRTTIPLELELRPL